MSCMFSSRVNFFRWSRNKMTAHYPPRGVPCALRRRPGDHPKPPSSLLLQCLQGAYRIQEIAEIRLLADGVQVGVGFKDTDWIDVRAFVGRVERDPTSRRHGQQPQRYL